MQKIIGRFYWVAHLYVAPPRRTAWIPHDGWVPVIGPKHNDAEFLQFPYEHYHVDWRFLPSAQWRLMSKWIPVHRHVVTGDAEPNTIIGEPQLRKRRYQRAMPEFPEAKTFAPYPRRLQALEIAQAFRCNKLLPGNICPHRGIALDEFARADGTAICPGHGLLWDLRTGALLPRHAP
jgi:hypothetical protein